MNYFRFKYITLTLFFGVLTAYAPMLMAEEGHSHHHAGSHTEKPQQKVKMPVQKDAHKHHKHPKKGATLYQCPMHPQITSDRPNQECPICGMDLVLIEDDDQEGVKADDGTFPKGHAGFKLSPYRRQMIGLRLGVVKKKELFKTISAPGRIAFDPELYTAQNEYQEAIRQRERVKNSPLESVKANVRKMIQSARIRLKVLGLSDAQIGKIGHKSNLSESLLVYKKGGLVWVYADVFEMDLRNISPGQSVKIMANFLEGKIIPGVVASVDQVINPKTRTAKVRIKINKAPVQFRPESYVNVKILVPQGKHNSIPLDAVVDTGEESFVFVHKGEGRFDPRKIVISFRAGDEVAVSSGLNEGDEIVTSGNFLVDSESRLKGVLRDLGRK